MNVPDSAGDGTVTWGVRLNRALYVASRHWLLLVTLVLLVWTGLPWLAPLLMDLGWSRAADFIYLAYAFQCHQLPQRSFFLFGSDPMVDLQQIQQVWRQTADPTILRQFKGNPDMGWKVAWSDRMVYMYTGMVLAGMVYGTWRRRIRPLSLWGLGFFLLPMAIDGATHMLSDMTGGVGGGFRYGNGWLALLTRDVLPASFYAGDALGSFNSWMRLISGIFFSIGVVWYIYPRLHQEFVRTAHAIEAKFEKANLPL